ncbi:MAG: sensor histidine kinase [Tannerella sp.]|jgi:signal transduction histidine kinase|nr:sensor histidine kinase [Tannerella sp.]
MKRIIFIAALFLCSLHLHTQINADSLINVLETQKLTSIEKFGIYNNICYFFLYNDPDKAISYAEKAYTLSKKEKKLLWISICKDYMGRAFQAKGEYDKAIELFNEALDIAIKEKIDHQEAFVHVSIASLYSRLGKSITAIDYLLKALSIYEKRNDKNDKMQQAVILTNLGQIHRGLENNERAIHYSERALVIADELDYTRIKILIFYGLGSIHRIEKNYDEALKYQKNAIELSQIYKDKSTESAALGSLALIYAEGFADHTNAEICANASLKIATELNDPFVLIAAWRILSEVYIAQERYKEGELAATKAWEIDSTSLDQAPYIIGDIVVSNIHLGNKEKAAASFYRYIDVFREMTNKNSQNLISDLEVKYETEKKEMRIATLEKEKLYYIWLGIAAVTLLLMAFGILFYRHRLNIQKRKNAEQEKELAEKQMILAEQQREIAEQKNELAEQKIIQLEKEKQLVATQSVLDGETAERSRLARDLHDGLGGMLSVVKLNLKEIVNYSILEKQDVNRFNKALDLLDQSVVELRRVAHHLMPDTLTRYGLRVSIEDFCNAIPNAHFQYFGNDKRLDKRLEVVLYRCAHELVNNAVKYADATAINVQLMIDNGLVSLTVQDNGIGFNPEKVTSGSGLDNIHTRVSAYNGKMTIHSAPDKGTEISIEIENTNS